MGITDVLFIPRAADRDLVPEVQMLGANIAWLNLLLGNIDVVYNRRLLYDSNRIGQLRVDRENILLLLVFQTYV